MTTPNSQYGADITRPHLQALHDPCAATHEALPTRAANDASGLRQVDEADAGRYDSVDDLAGFEQYEAAVSFLTNLGVAREEAQAVPLVIMTSIGSLLKQADFYGREIRHLHKHLKEAEMTMNRLRAQRNAMRSHLRIIGAIKET